MLGTCDLAIIKFDWLIMQPKIIHHSLILVIALFHLKFSWCPFFVLKESIGFYHNFTTALKWPLRYVEVQKEPFFLEKYFSCGRQNNEHVNK